ncbi:cytoplasmic aconitate hydratase [Lepeophtheirus salmonis]|uniref:IRP1B n=1 Tax=Lepeophtheirus salmonis TaxID=72036 RepID=A0A0C5DNQ1_LEPSM|nr:cytoplasmic aconitate hydratase-like [Lepeophtheirus salmonis]AJO69942.1 IRP1B [Lepeophtheirus salmonis]
MKEGPSSGTMEDEDLLKDFQVGERSYKYYDVTQIQGYEELPYSLRVLLECAVRKRSETQGQVWKDVYERILSVLSGCEEDSEEDDDILFHPGRVLLQDFTGVPALIDLAAIRESVSKSGGCPDVVDSLCPADLVVDHCVQVDYNQIKQQLSSPPDPSPKTPVLGGSMQPCPTVIVHSTFPPPFLAYPPPPPIYTLPAFYPISSYQSKVVAPSPASNTSNRSVPPMDNPGLPIQDDICPFHQKMSYWADALRSNQTSEFERNKERFIFLKWVNSAFKNITVIPPGTGVMHQVNLEYLARVVTCQGGVLFPDSVVGTDTHTTMINGLGVLGWGVGTLDAQAVMFGHPVTLSFPRVVGIRIKGVISDYSTSTDLVLMITKKLRQAGVQGAFVEFFGPSLKELSVADRATISNMCPEYGALVGFFPIDEITIQYLAQSGRDKSHIETVEKYMKTVKMFRSSDENENIRFASIIEIDLSDIIPCVSGPKRTKDKVSINEIAADFKSALHLKEGPKGYGLSQGQGHVAFSVNIDGEYFTVGHGTVLLAAISSCTNTSNPSVMLGAGLLAKKAVECGLSVPKVVKTSLAPGSGVVTSYLQESGVMPYLYMLGFEIVGYGCSTCSYNSGPNLPDSIVQAIKQGNLVCCGLLSGNRNFEGRLDPDIRANYLASPLMVIAYAIAGRIDINLDREPLGFNSHTGEAIFLKNIWPSRQEIQEIERKLVIPGIYRQVYSKVSVGNKHWDSLSVPNSVDKFPWSSDSTYIKCPEYIKEIGSNARNWKNMRCLLKLGDNITSDHISPAGSITRSSPAAEYLSSLGLAPREYNSYGARRGNYHVMVRGTFSNMRLQNHLLNKVGPYTLHLPSEVTTTIFEASERYKNDGVSLFAIGGKNFGRGTSRDWATRGPFLLGVRAILAVSFDPTYRSNLVKTGILPLQITSISYESLKGTECLSIDIRDNITPKCLIDVVVGKAERSFKAVVRVDNDYETDVFHAGGVIAQIVSKTKDKTTCETA